LTPRANPKVFIEIHHKTKEQHEEEEIKRIED